jgi:hypothetical protein
MTGDLVLTPDIHLVGTGTLDPKLHLELVKIYNDSYYVNQDTFTYLFILGFISILLTRSLIKYLIFVFKIGFSLSSNENILV